MAASKMYGVLLGLVLVALNILRSPIAWTAFWTIQAVLLATYTILTWKRTGLLWVTVGGAHATLIALFLIPASLAGYAIGSLPPPLIAVNLLGLFAAHILSMRVYRDQWGRWKHHMDGMTLFDMLRFRHIPYLR